MKSEKSYKRIHFRLDEDLAQQFDQRAKKEGVTKAKLLRGWLENSFNNSISFIKHKQSKKINCFNYRISESESKILKRKTDLEGIKKSEFLRMLISSQLQSLKHYHPSAIGNISSIIQRLWMTGKLVDLTEGIDEYEFLEIYDLITICQSYLEIGNLKKVSMLLELISLKVDDSPSNNLFIGYYYYIKGEMNRLLYEHESAYELYSKAEIYAQEVNNKELLGRIHEQFGLLFQYKYNLPKAEYYYNSSLHHLNREGSSIYIAEVYLKLCYLNLLKMNYRESRRLLNKSRTVIDHFHNVFYLGRYHHIESMVELHDGNLVNAKHKINKGLRCENEAGSTRGKLNLYTNMGNVCLAQMDYDEAYRCYKKATECEVSLQKEMRVYKEKFIKSHLFKLYIESKDNFQESLDKINYIYDITENKLLPYRFRYVISSIKYINGPNWNTKRQGEKELKELSSVGKYPLLKNAIDNVLITRAIQPIR